MSTASPKKTKHISYTNCFFIGIFILLSFTAIIQYKSHTDLNKSAIENSEQVINEIRQINEPQWREILLSKDPNHRVKMLDPIFNMPSVIQITLYNKDNQIITNVTDNFWSAVSFATNSLDKIVYDETQYLGRISIKLDMTNNPPLNYFYILIALSFLSIAALTRFYFLRLSQYKDTAKRNEALLLETQKTLMKSQAFESSLLANISHELRTPLTSIHGSLGLIKGGISGELTPSCSELINMAERNSHRLTETINQILDARQIGSQLSNPNFEKKNINNIILSAIRFSQRSAKVRNINFQFISNDKNTELYCDPGRIQQAIQNLLSNAIKFSPSDETIILRLDVTEKNARIIIADRGKTLSEKCRERIFVPFFQNEEGDCKQFYGLGLGLSIAQAIAQEHGGEINILSTNGQVGNQFCITLPLEVSTINSAEMLASSET